MVGLYKDPDEINITMKTTMTEQSDEVGELRRRINELEQSLKEHTRVSVWKC